MYVWWPQYGQTVVNPTRGWRAGSNQQFEIASLKRRAGT
jgi:hypothetical protein